MGRKLRPGKSVTLAWHQFPDIEVMQRFLDTGDASVVLVPRPDADITSPAFRREQREWTAMLASMRRSWRRTVFPKDVALLYSKMTRHGKRRWTLAEVAERLGIGKSKAQRYLDEWEEGWARIKAANPGVKIKYPH